MSKAAFGVSDPTEWSFLSGVELRLITREERARWNELVSQHPYLGNGAMVGEQLCYVAQRDGKWLALLGWSAAAYHLKGRDGWIGWDDNQRRERLLMVANNARYCLLTQAGEHPNLASHVMGLNLSRLSGGLAGSLRSPDSGGGKFCGSAALPRDVLQSHGVAGGGLHGWVQAGGGGFLPSA